MKQDRQMRMLAIAFAFGILAAVATMFVPIAMLESITGATGISELVRATAAPLGDTARALIAFGTGALTLAFIAVILLRQESQPTTSEVFDFPSVTNDDETPSLRERIADILPVFQLPKMPWVKDEDDITELADLPKLRNGDAHPDAPPRRPLLATQDLPIFDLTDVVAPVEPVAEGVEPSPASPVEIPTAPITGDMEPTLAAMVAQLEASVAKRQQQLAELELVAAKLAVPKPVIVESQPDPDPILPSVDPESEPEPVAIAPSVAPARTPLEAVPASPEKLDDMDAALAAALATLHRMNGTDR